MYDPQLPGALHELIARAKDAVAGAGAGDE
jgi:hypothetical protein